jgi:hypothetical protein
MTPRLERGIVRVATIVLTLASSWLLAQLAPDLPGRSRWLLPIKALGVATALNIGLFFAPDARRWWRLLVAALMLPAALIFAGLAGETVTKIVRGRPLHLAGAITSVGGTLLYAWAFWLLARPAGGFRRLTSFIHR